jgi:hypothetical protein
MLRFPMIGRCAALVMLAAVSVHAPVRAQRFGRNQAIQTPVIPTVKYDGRFTFARLSYATNSPAGYYYGGLPAWAHGYDLAERNLMQILTSLSTLQPRLESGVVMSLDDPELFKYPLAYMAEPGWWGLTDKEALAFRKYLLKGGFVIFDDFRDDFNRGNNGYANFRANLLRILPNARVVDITPKEEIFHSFYEINSFSIVPQSYDRAPLAMQAVYEDNDPGKRMLAIINFNQDVSDFWEFSGQGRYPISESNQGYKLGVNYLIYAMSH